MICSLKKIKIKSLLTELNTFVLQNIMYNENIDNAQHGHKIQSVYNKYMEFISTNPKIFIYNKERIQCFRMDFKYKKQ